MNRLTRREFLIKTAFAAAGAELTSLLKPTPPVQGQAWPSAAIAQGTNQDSAAAILKTALDGVGGIERFVRPGQTVAIKPNATWAWKPHTASASDPEILAAIIELVKQAGAARIIVMDHISINPGTVEALRVNGLGRVVDSHGVEKVFPDRFDGPKRLYTTIEFESAKNFRKLGVIKAAVEADVRINLAVAKTHDVTKMTMCLKHMMGFLENPGELHARIEQGIADINTSSQVKANLHILEAIRVRMPYKDSRVCAGPETDLTHPNIVRRINQVVAGTDPVLIDSYGCVRYYSTAPRELAYIQRSFELNLGEMDVDSAFQAGRLVEYQVGQPRITPTRAAGTQPTPVKTIAAVDPFAPSRTPAGTPTPLPTALPELEGPGIQLARSTGSYEDSTPVINPNTFLNGALIPAAAVIVGVGLAAGQRLRKSDEDREDLPNDKPEE